MIVAVATWRCSSVSLTAPVVPVVSKAQLLLLKVLEVAPDVVVVDAGWLNVISSVKAS